MYKIFVCTVLETLLLFLCGSISRADITFDFQAEPTLHLSQWDSISDWDGENNAVIHPYSGSDVQNIQMTGNGGVLKSNGYFWSNPNNVSLPNDVYWLSALTYTQDGAALSAKSGSYSTSYGGYSYSVNYGAALSNAYGTNLTEGTYEPAQAVKIWNNQSVTQPTDLSNNFLVLFPGYTQGDAAVDPYILGNIEFASPETLKSVDLNNTLYVLNSIANGDGFSTSPLSYDANSYFGVRITASHEDGSSSSVQALLADFLTYGSTADSVQTGKLNNAATGDYYSLANGALRDWATLDLTSLGEDVVALEFSLFGSDMGAFGLNTPGYLALDNLILASNSPNPPLPPDPGTDPGTDPGDNPGSGGDNRVPEPSSGLLLLLGILTGGWYYRSRSAH